MTSIRRGAAAGAALGVAAVVATLSMLISPAAAGPVVGAHTSGPDAQTYYGSVIPDINLHRVYLNERYTDQPAAMELTHEEFIATYGYPRSLPDDEIDTQVVALINQERAQRGIAPVLEFEPQRAQAALWSNTMAATGVFRHDPQGLNTGVTICECDGGGETILKGSTTAEAIVNGYMLSDPHRAILMDPAAFYIGSATVADPNGMEYNTIRTQVAFETVTCPRTTPYPGHPDWYRPGPVPPPVSATATPQPTSTAPTSDPHPTPTPAPTRTPSSRPSPSPSATTTDRKSALTVRVASKQRASRIRVNVGPDRVTVRYTVKVHRAIKGKWKTVSTVRVQGRDHVRTVNVPAGRYRVVVPRQHHMAGVTSRVIRIKR